MRKVRDYDAELKALDDKAKRLKERKLQQLGELVIACRADTISIEHLAGALLAAVDVNDAAAKEACRVRGAAFFRGSTRNKAGGRAGPKPGHASSTGSGAQSASTGASTS
ncbi:conjugal transfer protein TraC [Sphingomonas koreensis]|nr:conjugal transfer protein TraC [Sphingomonas koreensis]